METYLIIAIVASVAVLFIGYYLGSKGKNANSPDNSQLLDNMREQIASLEARLKEKDSTVARMTDEIRGLTSQRDVQKPRPTTPCRPSPYRKKISRTGSVGRKSSMMCSLPTIRLRMKSRLQN